MSAIPVRFFTKPPNGIAARVVQTDVAGKLAGTTRLELATSAVTVSGLQVLSTTWKSTDGTASHWKYIIGNVIVYRDVYRADLRES